MCQIPSGRASVGISATSDNLTPQETANQDTPDMGADGASLSCPGSAVAGEDEIRTGQPTDTIDPKYEDGSA